MVRHAAAVALVLTLNQSWLSAQSTTFTVTTDSADVHKAPSTGSAVIGHAARGRALPVTRELGSWVKVAWPGAEDGGYLNVSWGRLGGRSAAAEAAPAAAAPSPRSVAPAAGPVSTAPAIEARGDAPHAALRPVYVTPASHAVGLGARMVNSPMGFGVSGRAWQRRFGVQIDASRYSMTSDVSAFNLTSMEIEPSVMFALRDRVGDYLWVRPYAGSGVMLRRQSLNNGQPGAASTTSNGLGWQAFGGGELTFAGAPQFAISTAIGYRRLTTPVEGFDLGGVGLSLSAHWYVK